MSCRGSVHLLRNGRQTDQVSSDLDILHHALLLTPELHVLLPHIESSSSIPIGSNQLQVFRVAVKLCGNMAELDKKLNSSETSPIPGHTLMHVTKFETQFLITFADGMVMGEVNASLDKALSNIAEQQYTLDFEVFAPVLAIRQTISRATKEKDAIVRVQISVYGPRKIAKSIGQEFSQQKIFLQDPDHVRDGAEYDNPHVLKLTDYQHALPTAVIDIEKGSVDKTNENLLAEAIADVYSSLTRDKNLRGLEGDERLKTPLLP